jgi:hypothetical protein
MKIRTLLGIAAIAGYYAHRQRGGQLTIDSIKDSFRALGDSVSNVFQNLKSGAMGQGSQMQSGGGQQRTGAYDADIVEPMESGGAPYKGVR